MLPEREEQYTPWWKLSKDEFDALPDLIPVKGGFFTYYVTKELLEDFRPLCEMRDRIMRRYKDAT